MREHAHAGMSLYGSTGSRKYLNAAERRRFIKAARRAPLDVQLFCLVLSLTGGRISEILALTSAAIDVESGVANIMTLKRRKRGIVRQVPLPLSVLGELNRASNLRRRQRDPDSAYRRIWKWRIERPRGVALRRSCLLLISPVHTQTPKGLRHGFGVNAFQSNVPPHLVQRWLGHASLRTTSIYGDVVGPEERALAARMWKNKPDN